MFVYNNLSELIIFCIISNMNSGPADQIKPITKQQNKQQESEMQTEQKNNLNTLHQHNDSSRQFNQYHVQNQQQFNKEQLKKFSGNLLVMNENSHTVSDNENLRDPNTQPIAKMQVPNQQIQKQSHNSQYNAQKLQNIHMQYQKSVAITIIGEDNLDQMSIKKLEQSNKIQEQKREQIQTATLMAQNKKLNAKLAEAEAGTKISQLVEQLREQAQKLAADVFIKQQTIQELQKRASHENYELKKVEKDLKQLKKQLQSQKSNLIQAQLNQQQFQNRNKKLECELVQLKKKNQQNLQKILQITEEKKRLAEQIQSYINKNKQYQSQLNKLTSHKREMLSEINNLQKQIIEHISQLSDKKNQITILIEKNKLLSQFQQFKLRQECELSALTEIIKNISQQNSNKLIEYVKKFNHQTKEDLKAIYKKIYDDYAINQQKLKNIKKQNEQKLKQLQQIYEQCVLSQQNKYQLLDQQYQKLTQQSQQLQQTSALLLKHSYSQINSLRQELSRLHNYCNQAEQNHQNEKYEMMKNICQYAQQINTLQAQLQANSIIQMEKDFKQQKVTNWLSDKYQSTINQFEDYKCKNQQELKQLKMQLSSIKKQLKENLLQSQKRQKCIIESLGQFHTVSQKEKDQYYNYTDTNKNILIQGLNQLVVINQVVYESKIMLKISQLKQQIEKYAYLESKFQNYKKQTSAELATLYTEIQKLQQKLSQTQQVKQSKIMIEEQYAVKEEILNNIIFLLDSKKEYTLADVIRQFQAQDTKREFGQLLNILISVSKQTEQIKKEYYQLREKINQINKNYQLLQRQRNEACARNQQLNQQLQKKQKILTQYKNKYVQMSTKYIQLEINLQEKQEQIAQSKKKVEQLLIENRKFAKDNQQQNKLNQRKIKNINELSDEIERMKFDKTSRTFDDDNRNRQSQTTKLSEEDIQRYKEDIRRQECKKNKSIVDQLQHDLTKKRKELDDAKQTIKKYQLQLKSQKQKEPHQIMTSPIFSSPQNMKSIGNSKSPLKLELKDSPNKSGIWDYDQKLFIESNILVLSEDEDFIKNTVQNYTGLKCVSAELKFKMQANRPDFLNEAKNALSFIDTGNLVWIFKKQVEVFGAVSFNKEIKQQQSALLFNLSKKKTIYPAKATSTWVPLRSDSFYLHFGVQQAKYIWKSRLFLISDLKTIKYFDKNKPLVGNFVSKQKMEVQQFQIFLLNIQK